MNSVLLIVLVLAGVIFLVFIIALFVKKEMHAEREVVINKPKTDVFNYVKQLKNQNDYSKWGGIDPAMKKMFTGTDGTVGFISAWESENKSVGQGEQEIKSIKEGERIEYDLRFVKPMKSNATCYMATETVGGDQTKVKWGFDGKMNYPFNIMGLIMNMEEKIGDDFHTGLVNLKAKLEN